MTLTTASKTNPCPHCGKPDWCYSTSFFNEGNEINLSCCKRLLRDNLSPAQGWYQTSKCDAEGTPYLGLSAQKQTRKLYQDRLKKATRPSGKREWRYTDRSGKVLLQVCRMDDGDGGKPIRWQERWTGENFVKGGIKNIARADIAIFMYSDVRQAIEAGKPIFIAEGEPACSALWNLGLAATTNLGGSEKWRDSDTSDLEGAAQIILCPDRDKVGIEHMEKIAENFPNAQWLYAYPESPFWHPDRIPATQGLDVADWVEDYKLTADDILKAVEPKRSFQEAEEEEEEEKKFNSKTNRKLHFIRNKIGSKLKYNLLKQHIEYDGRPLVDELDDQGGAKLFIAETLDIDVGDGDGLAILNKIAKENSYHPVLDYLNYCYQKHGKENNILDNFARRYFGTDDPLHQIYIVKYLVAACKRPFEPGAKFDTIFILQGKTGLRKSTFFKFLHGADFFTDSVLGTEEKDSLMILAKYWCCEYGEFEGITRKKELEEVKRFLSRDTDDYRAPYARTCKPHPREFVIAGTANRCDFLRDETGNRRFMIIPVDGVNTIPIETLKAERDRIWGAAMALYKAGVSCELSREEMEIQNVLNENFSQVDPWQDAVSSFLESRKLEFTPTTQILERAIGLDTAQMDQNASRRIGAIATILGFKRVRRRMPNGTIPWGYIFPDDPGLDHDPGNGNGKGTSPDQVQMPTQQAFQTADPDDPDDPPVDKNQNLEKEDTLKTCIELIKDAAQSGDKEFAQDTVQIIKEATASSSELKQQIWETLSPEQRVRFKRLIGELSIAGDNQDEENAIDTDNEILSKDMQAALAKGLKIGDRVVYDSNNNPEWEKVLPHLIRHGEVVSEIFPGKYEPLAIVEVLFDSGVREEVQVRHLERAIADDGSEEAREEKTSIYKTGDSILINEKHKVSSGKIFNIKEVRQNGWILTTEECLFHERFFSVIDSQRPLEIDDDSKIWQIAGFEKGDRVRLKSRTFLQGKHHQWPTGILVTWHNIVDRYSFEVELPSREIIRVDAEDLEIDTPINSIFPGFRFGARVKKANKLGTLIGKKGHSALVLWDNLLETSTCKFGDLYFVDAEADTDPSKRAFGLFEQIGKGSKLRALKHPDHKGNTNKIGTVQAKKYEGGKFLVVCEEEFMIFNLEAVKVIK